MNRFHGEKSVWPIVKMQIKKAKKSQQIFAAIAYIGIDAPKIMERNVQNSAPGKGTEGRKGRGEIEDG